MLPGNDPYMTTTQTSAIEASIDCKRPQLPSRPKRILLYSHDTMGLGHVRRNLLIAQALSEADPEANILLVTGAREVGNFSIPLGADCLVLPSLYKEESGQYRARCLNVSLGNIISLRSRILAATIADFNPDVFIADNVAGGAQGELLAALEYLRSNTTTRCILGLRDICDSPEAVKRDWGHQGTADTLRRYYHEIWVYGDPEVYNPIAEYNFPPDLAATVRFTGYLDQRPRLTQGDRKTANGAQNHHKAVTQPYILCTVGGGQDGTQLATAFVKCELPMGMGGVLLCGPHMDNAARQRLHQSAKDNHSLKVLDFVPEPAQLVKDAAAVICMGGYNSVCEALSHNKRTLIVPRVKPRKEQLIRAMRLKQLNIAELIGPDKLNANSLSAQLSKMLDLPPPNVHKQIDFSGLKKLPALLQEQSRPATTEKLNHACGVLPS